MANLKQMIDAGATIVDVRTVEEFSEEASSIAHPVLAVRMLPVS
jgi:rhodanese-related sulfurtransferase